MWWPDAGWWWFLMPLGMVVFWGLVAFMVLTVLRDGRAPATGDAERLVAERHARGEIDAAEYHRVLEDLRGHRAA